MLQSIGTTHQMQGTTLFPVSESINNNNVQGKHFLYIVQVKGSQLPINNPQLHHYAVGPCHMLAKPPKGLLCTTQNVQAHVRKAAIWPSKISLSGI